MKNYQNSPTDFTLRYEVQTYQRIEKLFDVQEGRTPQLHFLLALLGLVAEKRIPLDKKDSRSDETRAFSIRTMYIRDATDFDLYYGLVTILDNLDDDFDQLVNEVAFEKTGVNGRKFYEMQNVKTFYEYLIGGIEFFKENFFDYGHDSVQVADCIHDFLMDDDQEITELLEVLLEEEQQNENDES